MSAAVARAKVAEERVKVAEERALSAEERTKEAWAALEGARAQLSEAAARASLAEDRAKKAEVALTLSRQFPKAIVTAAVPEAEAPARPPLGAPAAERKLHSREPTGQAENEPWTLIPLITSDAWVPHGPLFRRGKSADEYLAGGVSKGDCALAYTTALRALVANPVFRQRVPGVRYGVDAYVFSPALDLTVGLVRNRGQRSLVSLRGAGLRPLLGSAGLWSVLDRVGRGLSSFRHFGCESAVLRCEPADILVHPNLELDLVGFRLPLPGTADYGLSLNYAPPEGGWSPAWGLGVLACELWGIRLREWAKAKWHEVWREIARVAPGTVAQDMEPFAATLTRLLSPRLSDRPTVASLGSAFGTGPTDDVAIERRQAWEALFGASAAPAVGAKSAPTEIVGAPYPPPLTAIRARFGAGLVPPVVARIEKLVQEGQLDALRQGLPMFIRDLRSWYRSEGRAVDSTVIRGLEELETHLAAAGRGTTSP